MVAEAPSFPRINQTTSSRAPLSSRQVEALLSRAVAVFGILFGVQTIPAAVAQTAGKHDQPAWTLLLLIFFAATLIATAFSAVTQQGVRVTTGAFAVAYLLAVASWPLAARIPLQVGDGAHWLSYLLAVSTAAAVIAFPVRFAIVYLLVISGIYGLAAVVTSGGRITQAEAALGGVYSVLLGGVVLIIITMLRRAAAAVDSAQAAALESYSQAVRRHATEFERVQVDAIVHDSVLTTLLSAARASSPEAKKLSARMAAHAIAYLQHAALLGPDADATMAVPALARRLVLSARAVGAPFAVRLRGLGAQKIPVAAAEAVYSAAVQAMVNSVQHAGDEADVRRWMSIRGVDAGILVEVGDSGQGFAVSGVSSERLGLRVSIVDRVTNAGGGVRVESRPGAGTVVTIRWPSPTEAG